MTIGRSCPDSSRYFAFSPSEYFVPSLKMLPISITRSTSSALPHCTHASPGATVCRSTNRAWKSRPGTTPRTWTPSRLAPMTNVPSRSVSSASTGTRTPTGPTEPTGTPRGWRTPSGCAARGAGRHELVGAEATHHARVRLHDAEAQAAALEDFAVRPLVRGVRTIERGHVGIEGVGILHHELARAQHARAGPGLVALLRLDLIPDLGEIAIGADGARRQPRDDLFVRHAQAHVAVIAVLQAEHLGADGVPPAAVAPDLGGVQ